MLNWLFKSSSIEYQHISQKKIKAPGVYAIICFGTLKKIHANQD